MWVFCLFCFWLWFFCFRNTEYELKGKDKLQNKGESHDENYLLVAKGIHKMENTGIINRFIGSRGIYWSI